MFQDMLQESWVYQEIGQGFLEKGLEKGREEERNRELQRQHQLLVSFVQLHFPEITVLVNQQTKSIDDPEVLQTLITRLFVAQTVEEAKQILLQVNLQ